MVLSTEPNALLDRIQANLESRLVAIPTTLPETWMFVATTALVLVSTILTSLPPTMSHLPSGVIAMVVGVEGSPLMLENWLKEEFTLCKAAFPCVPRTKNFEPSG